MAVFQKTAQAEEDLIDIWLYIAQDNPDAANQLLDIFMESLDVSADLFYAHLIFKSRLRSAQSRRYKLIRL